MILLGNFIGLIASLVGIAYFKVNDKNKICIYSAIMSILHLLAMIVLSAYSGLVVTICNILRSILVRYNKWNKYWIIGCSLATVAFTIYVYKSPFDFLSVIGMIINGIGFLIMQKGKIKPFRWMRFSANILWIGYYCYILNFTSMGFEIVYTIINLREIFKKEEPKLTVLRKED